MPSIVSRHEHLLPKVVVTCAGTAVVVGLVVLIGWAADISVLKSVVPGLASMKVNTALSFALSGLSLFMVGSHVPSRPRQQAVGLISASLILTVVLLTFVQYAFAINFGIDEFLFRDSGGVAAWPFPGRMAPITALVLLLIGLALLLIHVRLFPTLAQVLATLAVLVGAICCLSYLYGFKSLQSVFWFSSVAAHTSVLFLIVSLGLLAALPDRGLVGLLLSDGVGGVLVRRVLPTVVGVPVFFGWLTLIGLQSKAFSAEFGLAVFALSNIIVLATLVSWSASQIQKADVKRSVLDSALRASEHRLSTALTAGRMGAWAWDFQSNVAVWTDREYELLDYLPSDGPADAERFFKRVHPDDLHNLKRSLAEAIEQGTEFRMAFRTVRPNGKLQWLVGAGRVNRDYATGNPTMMYGINFDITEQKETEAALRTSEERLRLLIEGVKDHAIYTLGVTGIVETWNAGAARLYGYTADEIIGQHCARLFSAEDVASGLPCHEFELAATSGKISQEGWRVRKHGSQFWANGTMYVLNDEAGSVQGFVTVVRDLSEQKRAEAELQVRENRFRSLVTAISQIVWTADADGGNYVATPTWAMYTGQSEEEVHLAGWASAIHPDDQEKVTAQWRHSLETKEVFETDYRILRGDGEWRYFVMRGVPLLNDNGAVSEWVGVCEDDTMRRRAEEGIRLRDRAIQAASQGIIIIDSALPDDPIIYASRGFEGITGYMSDEVLGRNCRILQGKDTDPATVRLMSEAVKAGRECAVEILNYKQDGTPFWNALFMTPVRDEHGKLVYFVGVLADVTERRRLERALQQSQKMEAVGWLASGVAHDFNNLLTVISGCSDLLLTAMSSDNSLRGFVVEIEQAGERAAALTRQLLAFSRKEVIQPVVLNLNDVIVQSEKMLRRLLRADIAIDVALSPALPRVKADPGQMDQVIMNLCVNARDAMPLGGRLTIETNEFRLIEQQSAYPELTPGRYAQLCVTDTGHGMTETVMAQIFEPFFTTKEPGKGTGLGLATVFGIVKQSDGVISVHSEVGVGTTVKIFLPAVDTAPPPTSEVNSNHVLDGSETILLVEDEEGVRTIARIFLEAHGYKVLEAVSGTDAILTAKQHFGPIHLLVTDVVMPEMGGRQMADALRVVYPGLKVLYMSGYTDDDVIKHGITEQTDNFLQKPFGSLGLAKKVRALLDN